MRLLLLFYDWTILSDCSVLLDRLNYSFVIDSHSFVTLFRYWAASYVYIVVVKLDNGNTCDWVSFCVFHCPWLGDLYTCLWSLCLCTILCGQKEKGYIFVIFYEWCFMIYQFSHTVYSKLLLLTVWKAQSGPTYIIWKDYMKEDDLEVSIQKLQI